MFEHDCTIFNIVCNKEKRLDEIIMTHLYGVLWQGKRAARITSGGAVDADSIEIIIPMIVKSDKIYKIPKRFYEDTIGAYTLAQGDKIVKGIVQYSGNISRISGVFDDVMTITEVETFDCGNEFMRHWCVKGV